MNVCLSAERRVNLTNDHCAAVRDETCSSNFLFLKVFIRLMSNYFA